MDIEALTKDIYTYVRAMDDIVTENGPMHAISQQREFSENYRNIGIGIMSMADFFLKLGIRYGSGESVEIIDQLMREVFRTAVMASSALAQERGCFPKYTPKV